MDIGPFEALFEAMQSLIAGMFVLIVVVAIVAFFLALALGIAAMC